MFNKILYGNYECPVRKQDYLLRRLFIKFKLSVEVTFERKTFFLVRQSLLLRISFEIFVKDSVHDRLADHFGNNQQSQRNNRHHNNCNYNCGGGRHYEMIGKKLTRYSGGWLYYTVQWPLDNRDVFVGHTTSQKSLLSGGETA